MKKWYVYVTDRHSITDGWGADRVFHEIYEAETKDDVKTLVLRDFEYMPKVREKFTKTTPENERYITSIHEITGYWENIWSTIHTCMNCDNKYTKIEKLKMRTGGTAEYCSRECQQEYRLQFETPNDYDKGHVYMITHIPTGKQYVGVTVRWLMQRWWEHYKATSGSPLHQLMSSGQITDFAFQVLEVFKPSEVDPYEVEAKWIEHYNAVEVGLNAVKGHKLERN